MSVVWSVGGYGFVFEVQDVKTGQDYALKVMYSCILGSSTCVFAYRQT